MRNKAFTLIELLVVISVISLLASVVLASLNAARDKGRIGAGKSLAAQADHIAGDYALGYWDFDECSGTTAISRVGGNTAVFSGGVSWLADSIKSSGCSLSFDGSTGYASVANPLDQTTSYSYSFWIKPRTIQTSGLISNSPINPPITSGNGNSNDIYLNSNGTIGYFIFNGAGQNLTSTSVLSTGKWYHIAVSQDVTNGKRALYVNGAREAEDTNTSTQSFGKILINFNRTETGYFPGPNAFFDGQIDELHFYGKAFTADEVGKLYALEAPKYKIAIK
jgi:prepilin-type N-terminal cleavage/methylation domain-containing protein